MSQQLLINNKIEGDKVIKIAPFKKDIRKTTPHKHNNYFEIIYLSKGSGYHYIDLNKYAITPPVMFFVRQEQVHYWKITSEPEGYVVIIRKSFFEKVLMVDLNHCLHKSAVNVACSFQLRTLLTRCSNY